MEGLFAMFQDREALTGWQVRSSTRGGSGDILAPDTPLLSPRVATASVEPIGVAPRVPAGGVRSQLHFLVNAADQLEQELAAQREKNRRLETQIMDAYRVCEARIRDSSQKKETLFKENAELKATLDSYKYRNAELTAKTDVMDKEVKRLKEAAGKHESTRQNLKEEKRRMHQLVRDMKALAFENEDIARRLVELQAENTGLNDTLRRETVRRKDAERALLEIRDSAETLNRMHADFRNSSTRIDSELKQVRDHLEQLGGMATEAAHDARKSIQITEVVKFQIEKTLSEVRAETGRGGARLLEARTELEKMQAEINDVRARIAAARDARDEAAEKATRPLKQAHEIIAAQVDRQETWIRSLQESLGAVRAQIEELHRTQARLSEAQAEPKPAPPAVDTLSIEKEVAARYDRLNSLFTLKLDTMETKFGSRFASREPTQSTIQKLRKDLEETRSENLRLRDGLKLLHARLAALEKGEADRQAKESVKHSRETGIEN